jgi:D-alanyl-D-alanine carboxypeptidase (penicillin-binding protein 5/6)
VVVGALVVVLAGVYSLVQLSRSVPQPVVQVAPSVPAAHTVSGTRPALPWPSTGEAAVTLTGFGPLGSSGQSAPVPIASLAKVMAALVVLHDHPVAPGQAGPAVVITPAEAAAYKAESAAGDSVAPVTAGERLSEMTLLEALLVPSADNIAGVLAAWDAGGSSAFVAKMNATAAALGMHRTHYADENGLSSGTTSTASDQLRLAATAATNPVLMSVVRQPSVVLPDGTVLTNYDTLLGQSGVIGIKTGSTLAAGGCFMLAANATVAGHHVTVLAVVLGQRTSPFISAALQASRALVAPALAELHGLAVLPAGSTVAWVRTPWGQPVPVRTTKSVSTLGLAGAPVQVGVRVATAPVHGSPPAGSQVATVTVTAGGQVTTVPAVTAGPVPSASVRWRLERL